MKALMLATTLAEGRAYLTAEVHVSLHADILLVTPKSKNRARGQSVDHLLQTPGFRALHESARETVLDQARPAIATSPCPICRKRWKA